MQRALILAGGGILGIAWESGVLTGLKAGGIDTRRWDLVVGTSAGAYVGARLTSDGSPDPLFELETSSNDTAVESDLEHLFGPGFMRAVRRSRRPYLRWYGTVWFATFVLTVVLRHAVRHGFRSMARLATTLGPGRARADPQDVLRQYGAIANLKASERALVEHWELTLGRGSAWPPTRLIATAIDTVDGTRTLFEASSGVPLAEAVAASTCLPGLLGPVCLLGRRYMDGGIVSSTNADVATGHEEVWILEPSHSAIVDREVADLRSAGSRVHLVRPGGTAARTLVSGMRAFDPMRRLAAAQAGYGDGWAAAAALDRPVTSG